MNQLIVFMHPTTDSFNGAILNEISEAYKELEHDLVVRNLYKESFQPNLSLTEYKNSFERIYLEDIIEQQNEVKWADHISFIFPVWWGGFPAIGKGYLDRIFSYGFAYELEGESPIPKLNGKKASLIFTTGTPEAEFVNSGMYENMIQLIDKSTFQFCGLKLEGVLYFGDVIQSSDDERRTMLDRAKKFIMDGNN